MLSMKFDISLLALITGHLAGDLILKSKSMAEGKGSDPVRLLIHSLEVSAITWLFLGSFQLWYAAAFLFVLHFLIDALNARITAKDEDPNKQLTMLTADQLMHLLSLLFIRYLISNWTVTSGINCWAMLLGIRYTKGLLLISGFSLGVWGIAVILGFQMKPLALRIPRKKRKGLLKGGRIIGLLERTLVMVFVLAGKPEGVAFAVAAKSIFRIGDLADHGERLNAEYIMIGTLRSFTYALVVAFLMKWLIDSAL